MSIFVIYGMHLQSNNHIPLGPPACLTIPGQSCHLMLWSRAVIHYDPYADMSCTDYVERFYFESSMSRSEKKLHLRDFRKQNLSSRNANR